MNESNKQDAGDEARTGVARETSEGQDRGYILHGIGQAIIAVVLVQLLMPLIFSTLEGGFPGQFADPQGYNVGATILWLSIGWTQLLYLPLLALFAHRRGKIETRNGIAFVGGILFLGTSLCNALVMLS